MSNGLFSSVSGGYRQGGRSLMSWLGRTHWVFKPFVALWAVPAALVLHGIGLALYVLVLFDLLAALVDRLRDMIFTMARHLADGMLERGVIYLLSPLALLLLTPLIVVAGLIPKIGLDALVPPFDFGPEVDGPHFRRAAAGYRRLALAYWAGWRAHGLLFWPLGLPMAVAMIPLCLAAAMLFQALRLLDLVSALVDAIRQAISAMINKLADSAGNGLFAALLCPVLLVVLLPLFLAALLVPKFSTAAAQQA